VRNRFLMISLAIAGVVGAFALGVVGAPQLGAPFGRAPAVTVALDLMGEVRRLQGETAGLKAELAESAARAAALAEREAELTAARERIAALTERTAELEQAAQRTAALSEKVEGLRRARDRVRTVNAELEQHRTDLRAALQNNAAMAAKMEGLRRARDEAGEASAAQARTIAALRRDLAAIDETHEARQQALNAEISALREALEGKEREIARLRQTLEAGAAAAAPPAPAVSEPVAPSPEISLPVAPPPEVSLPVARTAPDAPALNGASPAGGTGVLDGAAAYRATDYARAYEIWRPLAERGNARAQFHIGALYYEGRGVAKNLGSARLWLERAAGQGSEPARALLARIAEETAAKGGAAKTPSP